MRVITRTNSLRFSTSESTTPNLEGFKRFLTFNHLNKNTKELGLKSDHQYARGIQVIADIIGSPFPQFLQRTPSMVKSDLCFLGRYKEKGIGILSAKDVINHCSYLAAWLEYLYHLRAKNCSSSLT